MSTTAIQFNLKQMLIATVNRIAGSYLNDLNFIPEGKATACPMGAARSATEFTAECAGFNRMLAGIIQGKEGVIPDEAARQAYYASIDSAEKAAAALSDSVLALTSAVEEADESVLAQDATMPWGETVPLYQAVQMAAFHMMYHDGQINYIQSLYGDAENHWH